MTKPALLARLTRKVPRLSTACIALLVSVAPAHAAFEGRGSVVGTDIILGDDSDGTGLYLSNTSMYCITPATRGSASIRRMLQDNDLYGNGQIYWYIDEECTGDYVRVCISTDSFGDIGCNTYRRIDWIDYDY